MKKYLCIIVMVLAASGSIPALCRAESTIRFGTVSDSLPFSFEENGVVKGFVPDLFREIARRAGLEIRLETYPVKRLEHYLESGEIDGAVFLRSTKPRKGYLLFSASPIITGRTLVFVRKGETFPFETVADLTGKRIGVMLGWRIENEQLEAAVKEGRVKLDYAPAHDLNVRKLLGERVDCIIGTEQVTSYYINQLDAGKDVVALDHPLSQVSAYICVSRHSNRIRSPKVFIRTLSEGLESVRSDGTYERIERQHMLSLPTGD